MRRREARLGLDKIDLDGSYLPSRVGKVRHHLSQHDCF